MTIYIVEHRIDKDKFEEPNVGTPEYEWSANIEVSNQLDNDIEEALEDVYEKTQNAFDTWTNLPSTLMFSPLHRRSLSVGDRVIAPNGQLFFVARAGFRFFEREVK